MIAKVTAKWVIIEAESEKDKKALERFLWKPKATLLWLNGATFSSSSGWDSMAIRKLHKNEIASIALTFPDRSSNDRQSPHNQGRPTKAGQGN